MQRRTPTLLVLLASLIAFAPDVRGHHSGTSYDYSRVAEVEGRVARVKWINPHAIIEITGIDKNGAEELWTIEGDSISTLQRKGFDIGTVRTGEQVRVQGAMSRYRRLEMRAAVLYLADGRQVVLNDRIAVDLGIIERPLSTAERISNTRSGLTAEERRQWIFRVWSRAVSEGYPRAAEPFLYTPEALAAREVWNPLTDDPALRCIPPGMPGVMANPYPIEFVERGEEIVLRVEEWDTERTIHMARGAVADATPTLLGRSVGHWEGDTLVVFTTNISWPHYDDVGTPQSAAMEVEERFTLAENGSRLEYVQTAVDPTTFAKPAVRKGYFWLEAGAEIKPYDCQR